MAIITSNHPSTIIFKMECYNTAIEMHSDVAKFYNERGDVYKYKKEYDKAADDYLKALELDPACMTTKSKKQLFEVFTQLSVDRQKELYRDCFNDETALGTRMWKPENFLIPTVNFFGKNPNEFDFIKCNPNKGTLKAIREQLKKIDPDWVDPFVTIAVISNGESKSEYKSLSPVGDL